MLDTIPCRGVIDSMHMRDLDGNLRALGLHCLGGFVPRAEDAVPDIAGSGAPAMVVVLGNAGPDMWRAYREAQASQETTLDQWTRANVDPVADRLGARALYPFDGPPYYPFQRWAWRTGILFPSPIKVAIHPKYGLWHAFRAALLLRETVAGLEAEGAASPCASCIDRPCLAACPVDAFGGGDYDVPSCRAHVAATQGTVCRSGGCLARHACPVGQDYAYAPEQAAFHMRSFLALMAGR